MNSDPPDDLIPLAEARLLLPSPRPGKKTSLETLYRKIHSGKLRAWKIDSWLFVSRAEVLGLPQRVGVEPPRREMNARTREGLKRYGVL
jgi:hypothetical protein